MWHNFQVNNVCIKAGQRILPKAQYLLGLQSVLYAAHRNLFYGYIIFLPWHESYVRCCVQMGVTFFSTWIGVIYGIMINTRSGESHCKRFKSMRVLFGDLHDYWVPSLLSNFLNAWFPSRGQCRVVHVFLVVSVSYMVPPRLASAVILHT